MNLTLKNLVGFVKRYPIGVICWVLSVVAIAGYYLRSSQIDELQAQFKQVEAKATKILSQVHNGANLPEQYAALTKATKELDSRLVRSGERARNQQYFFQIESEAGVKEINLQQNNIVFKKGSGRSYGRVGFTVSVEGNYVQILDFVGRLESGRHFCRMISAAISRRGDRGASGANTTLSLALTIELLGLP